MTTMIIADAERKAALQMLEQLEMILKIVSIYEEQHMHMNKMTDERASCAALHDVVVGFVIKLLKVPKLSKQKVKHVEI